MLQCANLPAWPHAGGRAEVGPAVVMSFSPGQVELPQLGPVKQAIIGELVLF